MERRWSTAVDRLIAAGVLLVGLMEIWVPFVSREGEGSELASAVQVAAVAAALLLRRTLPLVAAGVVFVLFSGLHILGVVHLLFYGQFVPMVLTTFAVARYGKGAAAYVGGAMIAAAMLLGDLLVPSLQDPAELVFHWGVLTGAYSLGTWQRVMATREEQARQRAVDAEVAAAEQAAAAILEERTRMARELHDVVAHAMSVIVVQAGAAQLAVDDQREVARSLETIRRTGSDALGEMRRLVSMLRDSDAAALLTPQPGLAAVDQLVADARASGLPVTLTVSGHRRELPVGLDLAAYRIVQEALTNARRHATEVSTITVAVDHEVDGLHLEIRDDGIATPETAGSGHGLIGMRERVHLYRGSLRAEPLVGRGFLVEAVLPLERA